MRELGLKAKTYLARQWVRLYPADMFVVVSGTHGKTSCLSACQAVLAQKYKTLATDSKDFTNTIFKLRPSMQKVVLEMGVDKRGDMGYLLSLLRPKIAIVTKIAYAPSLPDDVGEVLQEIGKLIESLPADGLAILNFDDPNIRKLAENCQADVVYFGLDSKNCTIWAGNLKMENFATTFELNLGVERVKVNYQRLGTHQVYAALAAALLGITCGIPLTKIKLGLEEVQPQEHSLQALSGPNSSILLDDTLNCSSVSFDGAIDTLLLAPARRRIVVLGMMQNLGKYSEKAYRLAAQRIYKEKLDLVFLGQGDTSIVCEELKSLGFWEERIFADLSNSQLVSKLLKSLGKGDVCLLCGSYSVRLDEVVKRIAKK